MVIDKAKAYDIDVQHTGTKSRMQSAQEQPVQTGSTHDLSRIRELVAGLSSTLAELIMEIDRFGK